MRTDGQADMTKPMVAFRNFAKAPKNQSVEMHFCVLQPETILLFCSLISTTEEFIGCHYVAVLS